MGAQLADGLRDPGLRTIDLRSDTVTCPTQAMRDAMAAAPVGDDVYGEDPSVNRLQEEAARRLGVEAALFVPSGTMANQIALRTLSRPGDTVLVGRDAHVMLYESGAPAALSGVQLEPVGEGGLFDGADVRSHVHPRDAHYAPTTVVALENTHNRAGGRVFPLDLAKDVAAAAREAGLSVHLDGARLWNAEAATGTPARAWAQLADTVCFCLSKGLGAPAGSLVCGRRELLEPMHRARKMLGGGMRQAGILAAAGLYALEHNVERLAEDHANAKRFAELVGEIDGIELTYDTIETNIVFFDVAGTNMTAVQVRDRLREEHGVKIGATGQTLMRAVTHIDVDRAGVERAAKALRAVALGE